MPCTRHIVHHRVARLPSPRGVITLHIPPPCRLNVFRHVRGSRRARWLRGPLFKSSTIFTMARVPTERERERERREKEREFSIGRRSLRLRKKRRINRQTFPTKRKKLLEGGRPYVFLPILPRFFFPNPFSTRRTAIIIFAFDRFIQFCYSSLEAKILTNHRRYCLLLPFPNNRSFVPFVFTTDTRIVGSEEDLNPGGGSCQGAIIDDGALMTAS